jgi:hypothetical protein
VDFGVGSADMLIVGCGDVLAVGSFKLLGG